MNGSIEATNTQSVLPTPRTSLQNIGEKRDEDDKQAQRNNDSFQAFGADGFTFLDFLDIINPLQHIPFVNTLYQNLTGDEIDPGSRIAGGTLFGGPIGTVVAMANVAVEHNTGQDLGDHMLALITGADDNLDSEGVQLANQPAPADLVTAAGEVAEGASPIMTNSEVLDWARRESDYAAGRDGEARNKQPEITPPAGSVEVATNIEVLNWARQEAQHAQIAAQSAEVSYPQRNRVEQPAQHDNQVAGHQHAVNFGRDQSQLAGATAPLGGWFSETMLVALAKYDQGAQLNRPIAERYVEESVDISE